MTDLVLDCPLTSDSGANSAMAMTVETVARNLCIIVPSRPVRAWLSRGNWLPQPVGADGLGLPSSGGAQQVLTLHAIPNICFSYELGCGADAGRAHYAALFHQRLHFT